MGEGTTARRHLDASVEGLLKAGQKQEIPRALLARAAAQLIKDTGYHRRDAEAADLRAFLDDIAKGAAG